MWRKLKNRELGGEKAPTYRLKLSLVILRKVTGFIHVRLVKRLCKQLDKQNKKQLDIPVVTACLANAPAHSTTTIS